MVQKRLEFGCGKVFLISLICLFSCLMLTAKTEGYGFEALDQAAVGLEGGFAVPMGPAFSAECTDYGVSAATECWRPKKSSRYSPSGVLQSYLKYFYDTVGQLIQTSRFDPADTTNPESYVTYKYNSKGLLTKVYVYDGSALKYVGKSEYNTNGRLTKGYAYDDNGTLMYYGTCSYNTKGKISKVSAYKPDKSLQYVGKIEYSGGQITKVSIYNASDVLQAYFTYSYDGKGRLSKETLYLNIFIPFKLYYTTYTYALGACPEGSRDPLFFWVMLASFLEL